MNDPPKPAEPLAPGNYDRSWNDPPLFSYTESCQQQSQHSGPKLSKRVGFPSAQLSQQNQQTKSEKGPSLLHDAGAKPSSLNSALPPPPPRLHDAGDKPPEGSCRPAPPPPIAMPVQHNNNTESNSVEDEQEDVNKVELCDTLKSGASRYCGSKSTDVIKRLSLMEKSLTSDSLSPRIVRLLHEIGKAIERENCMEAERKITTLSADHSGECAQWIIALRHILTSMKAFQTANKLSESDGNSIKTDGTPYFVPVLAEKTE